MIAKRKYERALDLKNGRIDMTHGSGGRAMAQVIEQLFARAFDNPMLSAGNDQACFVPPPGRMAFSTDSFVVSPLFFPGGDIGSLAVHGTVNDVSMSGAKPMWLSAGFIIEEGFPLSDLDKIVRTMAEAAKSCGVSIVTGDTKVVERGKADGLFINTAGIGIVPEGVNLSVEKVKAGDAVIVSGFLGDHGIAVMSKRGNLSFDTEILSDSAPLNGLVAAMIESGADIHAMRDPTRGGLATALNEIADAAGVGMRLEEKAVPIRPEVQSACEVLGLDPLYVACEGRLIAFCPEEDAEKLILTMKQHEYGRDASVIGKVIEDSHHFVEMKTALGGNRIVDWLAGEQLPRIC